MTEGARKPPARPGPKRAPGRPAGPAEVRRAVLDTAAVLFARSGVAQVSLRDIAAAADVHVSLINRYVGSRETLITAVFDDLASNVARDIVSRPRQQHTFDRDSALGQWLAILAHWMLTDQDVATALGGANPVRAMVDVIGEYSGLEPRAARIRAAQIVGSALGWRLFEPYLVAAADLQGESLADLHDELTAVHQRMGATDLTPAPHRPLAPAPVDPARSGVGR